MKYKKKHRHIQARLKLFISTLLSLICLISASGVARAYFTTGEIMGENADVEIRIDGKTPEITEITENDIVSAAYYIHNTGNEDCYVRVKLVSPIVNEKEVFAFGEKHWRKFEANEYTAPTLKKNEYWERVGDYLYYRNPETGNVLKRNSDTQPVFSAIRISLDLSARDLELVEEGQMDIVFYAQCVSAEAFSEEDAWEGRV